MNDQESDSNVEVTEDRRLSEFAFWACVVVGLGLLVLIWILPIFTLLGDYRNGETNPAILATHFVMLIVAVYVTVSGFRFLWRYRPDSSQRE